MTASLFFRISEWVVVPLFFGMILVAIEVGHRFGEAQRTRYSESCRSHVSGILAGSVGLLALMLSFTFSMAVARFDQAKVRTVAEANAVGTAFLRSQTLGADDAKAAGQMFSRYVVALQVLYGSGVDEDAFLASIPEMSKVQGELWRHGTEVSRRHPDMVPTGIYLQSLNEMIDEAGRRLSFLEYRIPETIYALLTIITLLTFCLAGFAAGLADARRFVSNSILALMVSIVFLVIVDLERPRRGLIQVDHTRIAELSDLIGSYGISR